MQRLAGAREIAETTLAIPHPYPDGAAQEWIASHGDDPDLLNFAVTLRESGELVGAVGLGLARDHARAELGYWIGVPYWGRGYATEAARAVVTYAFGELGLNRVFAFHFTNNPASGRVLQKIGMRHEGTRRAHTRKGDAFLDSESYAILRDD